MPTKYGNESFDVEFMMPPDIMSIDSDISKSSTILNSFCFQIKLEHWLLRRSRMGQEWMHSTWLRARIKHREVQTLNTKEQLDTEAMDLNLEVKAQTLEETI